MIFEQRSLYFVLLTLYFVASTGREMYTLSIACTHLNTFMYILEPFSAINVQTFVHTRQNLKVLMYNVQDLP